MTARHWNKATIMTLVLSLFISFVFIQSLFFKFAGAPETQHIFGILDQWATDQFGVRGLFDDGGLFSAKVIGSAELVAALLLLIGFAAKKQPLTAIGGLMATGIMSGAIVFHLFTPLGVVIENAELGVESDGGTLFIMACLVWISGLLLAFFHRKHLPLIGAKL